MELQTSTRSARFSDRRILKPVASGTPRRLVFARAAATDGISVISQQTASRSDMRYVASVFAVQKAPVPLPAQAQPQIVFLNSLVTKRLVAPLSVLLEQDERSFLAQTVDMPLYGSGNTPLEAIKALQREVESLYNDLMADDNFSDEWLARKKLMAAIVLP